jgi:aspartyl protease family protein
MPQTDSPQSRQIGKWMIYAAWALLLGMLTLFFEGRLARQYNPNIALQASNSSDAPSQVTLKRNRFGHYVTSGTINGQIVTFLVDTGATRISIPGNVARKLELKRGIPHRVMTANGSITVYSTFLERVALGPLEMRNLQGHVNPHMGGQEVLLGMNFLKNLEMIQRANRLTLKEL